MERTKKDYSKDYKGPRPKWRRRCPVTAEKVGSTPIGPAKNEEHFMARISIDPDADAQSIKQLKELVRTVRAIELYEKEGPSCRLELLLKYNFSEEQIKQLIKEAEGARKKEGQKHLQTR